MASTTANRFGGNKRTVHFSTKEPTLYDDDSDEEEQERHLSDVHGEAAEASSSAAAGKEGDKDEEIENLYDGKPKKKRMKKASLTPEQLSAALVKVPLEFPKALPACKQTVISTANYTRTLLNLYTELCTQLDTDMSRIQSLGSKMHVKDFLKEQRNHITRNPHLESIFGPLQTSNLLQQLEDYQKADESAEPEAAVETEDAESAPETEHDTTGAPTQPAPTASTTATIPAATADDDSDEEMEFTDEPQKPSAAEAVLEDSDDDELEIAGQRLRKFQRRDDDAPGKAMSTIQDSDEEEDELLPKQPLVTPQASTNTEAKALDQDKTENEETLDPEELLDRANAHEVTETPKETSFEKESPSSDLSSSPSRHHDFLGQSTPSAQPSPSSKETQASSDDDEVATIVPTQLSREDLSSPFTK